MSKQLTVFFVNARSQVLTSELLFHLCVLLYFLNLFCCLYTDALVIVSCSLVICLSETRPPHPGDKNEIAPAGVMAIKYFNVLLFVIRPGLGPCSQITRSSYKNVCAVYYAAAFF